MFLKKIFRWQSRRQTVCGLNERDESHLSSRRRHVTLIYTNRRVFKKEHGWFSREPWMFVRKQALCVPFGMLRSSQPIVTRELFSYFRSGGVHSKKNGTRSSCIPANLVNRQPHSGDPFRWWNVNFCLRSLRFTVRHRSPRVNRANSAEKQLRKPSKARRATKRNRPITRSWRTARRKRKKIITRYVVRRPSGELKSSGLTRR